MGEKCSSEQLLIPHFHSFSLESRMVPQFLPKPFLIEVLLLLVFPRIVLTNHWV